MDMGTAAGYSRADGRKAYDCRRDHEIVIDGLDEERKANGSMGNKPRTPTSDYPTALGYERRATQDRLGSMESGTILYQVVASRL
jgi:hypothetical protein